MGAVISPLLANVYLHALDRAWQERHGRLGKLTRYADDLVITCWQPWQAKRALGALGRLLAEFGLQLSPTKTRIVDLNVEGQGFDFLGYHFRRVPVRRDPTRRFCACWPSHDAMVAARQRLRELTPLERVGLPAIMVVQDVNRFLKGWAPTSDTGTQPSSSRPSITSPLSASLASSPGSTASRGGAWASTC